MRAMKRKYDRFFRTGETYIFVNTSRTEFYAGAKRTGFVDAVAFGQSSSRGNSLASNYPVVFDDFTAHGYDALVEVSRRDIPVTVMRRYFRWEALQ